jgi:hypothetical protein
MVLPVLRRSHLPPVNILDMFLPLPRPVLSASTKVVNSPVLKTSGSSSRNTAMLSSQPAPTLHRKTVESNASTKPLALWYGAFCTPPVSHLVFGQMHYYTPCTSKIGCGTVPFDAPHTKHTLVRSLTCPTYVSSAPLSPLPCLL